MYVNSTPPNEEDLPRGHDPDTIIVDEGDGSGYWSMTANIFYVRDVAGKEIAVYDGAVLKQWNLWGLDNVGTMKANGNKLFYMKDHLGSIRAVMDTTNAIVAAYDYDACLPAVAGTAQAGGYPLENRSYEQSSSTGSKYKFTAKERDRESSSDGIGYDYFGARYYDSRTGRWGGVELKYDENLSITPYIYSSNNPICKLDENGRDDYYFHSKNEVEIYETETQNYYYVQSNEGNVEYKGEKYFLSNSYETATMYDWKSFDLNFGNTDNGKFKQAFHDAKPDGIYEKNLYAFWESQPGGKMDQKAQVLKNETILYVLNNIAYNKNEAGNMVWGAVMFYMGFTKKEALEWANAASIQMNKRPDEEWDQRAISRGIDFYRENQNDINKK